LHIVLWFVGQIVCDFRKFSGPCPIFHPSLPPPQNMWLLYWYWGYSGKMRGGGYESPPHLLFVHKSVLVTAAFCLRLFLGMGRVLTDWTPPPSSVHPFPPSFKFFQVSFKFFLFSPVIFKFSGFSQALLQNIVSGYHLPSPSACGVVMLLLKIWQLDCTVCISILMLTLPILWCVCT
jgi:hypothetical protein